MDKYFSRARKEILPFVPKHIRNCLDVGCGEGHFGLLLKNEKNCEVWGIEPNSEAYKKSKSQLDFVINDIFDEKIKSYNKNFDCIFFNDVLEHMYEPDKAIQLAKDILSEDGFIICSIPNFLYWPNVKQVIINREWNYTDAGILDRTHLRFYTRRSIIKLFESLNLEIISINGINKYKGRAARIFNDMILGCFDDYLYMQYLSVLKIKN